MKNILISGGTGFIGSRLINHLLATFPDVQITVLVRDESDRKSQPRVRYCKWDVKSSFISSDVPTNIDTIIHLAGANIAAKRWTKQRKKVLLESRTECTKLLTQWVNNMGKNVNTFVSASAIGWYGSASGERSFIETDPAANDFLAHVCAEWEAASQSLSASKVRIVWIRTGLVLHPDGGMWKAMRKAFAFRVAPRFGHGKQVFSWISLEDLLRLYTFAAVTPTLAGAFNAVAPKPEGQAMLTKKLLKKKSTFAIQIRIPASLLKIGLGELSQELLKHAPVSSRKVEDAGFSFLHPTLDHL